MLASPESDQLFGIVFLQLKVLYRCLNES